VTPDMIAEAALRLDTAERTKVQTRQFSLVYPNMTIADAYAIQNAWIAAKQKAGRIIRGHKIGLTSRAMQNAANINEPDYGALLDDMFFDDGSLIPTERFIQTRVEAELAFVLKKPLRGPHCTIFDVFNATDFVTPALEILDTGIDRVDAATGQTRKVVDTISDNAANASIVLGGRPFRPMEVDMRWIGVIVARNGQIEETGVAAGVLNHPANGIAWLANRLAPYGQGLDAGEVVLAGSFIRPIEARKGDTFHADYGPGAA
jgi:2-oxo-hept-3-ene-1,7-dioate hydratase